LRSVVHSETDFDGHLPVMHFSLFNVAACFDHLKPALVLDGFLRPLNGLFNGVLDGIGGSAGEFDELIDGVFHVQFLESRIRSLKMSVMGCKPTVDFLFLMVFRVAERRPPPMTIY
jgi:hypothetical protein